MQTSNRIAAMLIHAGAPKNGWKNLYKKNKHEKVQCAQQRQTDNERAKCIKFMSRAYKSTVAIAVNTKMMHKRLDHVI